VHCSLCTDVHCTCTLCAPLQENIQRDFPDVQVGGSVVHGTWLTALLFGVSSAMLGVSGFESSSQFVEEQATGVFVKTLKVLLVLRIVQHIVCAIALVLCSKLTYVQ
jgi:hypothetical protein